MPAPDKELSIGGQTFVIKKMTPQKACKWAFRLFGSMATAFGSDSSKQLEERIQEFTDMPEAKFNEFQKDCLSRVLAVLEAGQTPVINSEGNFAIQLDGPTAFQLTLHAFMFTVMDFFAPGVMEGLMGSFSSLQEATPAPMQTPAQSFSFNPSSTDSGSTTTSGTEPTT